MGLPGINVDRNGGALGRAPAEEDHVSGIIIPVTATYGGGLGVNNFVFNSLDEAEYANFSASQDATHKVVAHGHIEEFFRLSPNGTLYVRTAVQGTTLAVQLGLAGGHAESLLNYAEGKIRQLGIVLNPASSYAAGATITTGLDADVIAGIAAAQALSVYAEAQGMPLIVLIEGVGFSGVSSTVLDLGTVAAPNVGVVIAQDYDTRVTNTAAGYASIGTALGAFSKSAVHENIGWVQENDLSDTLLGRYKEAWFSSDTSETAIGPAGLETLHQKGYIFMRTFKGLSGTYFVDDNACVEKENDYRKLRYTRTTQKAVREVRKVLLPLTNSPMYLDNSGKLTPGQAKTIEGRAGVPLQLMLTAGEISEFDVNVNLDQNILQTDELNVTVAILPVGCSSYINVGISLTTSIQ